MRETMIPIERYIDHTLLKADCTAEMIEKLCSEARTHQFKAVCVNPWWVRLAVEQLKGSGVLVATVIGFPLGATYPTSKMDECCLALEEGASEFDMVINIGALKSNQWDYVSEEIEGVVSTAQGKTVKAIIEACLLSDEEKKLACRLAREAGAHFVKTSTGFSTGGATFSDVALMREEAGGKMGVKASGGIRDLKTALAMLSCGATRLGTSAGVSIVNEMRAEKEKALL